MGILCFYNKTNGELETYPDGLDYEFENDWIEVTGKIESPPDDYLQIEKMNSHEAYGVIEDFVDGINDMLTQRKFVEVIS